MDVETRNALYPFPHTNEEKTLSKNLLMQTLAVLALNTEEHLYSSCEALLVFISKGVITENSYKGVREDVS